MAFGANEALVATGALSGSFRPTVARTCEHAIDVAEIVLLALPCKAHRKIMDMIAPLLRPDQMVIISSHCSLGAIYLARLLSARHVAVPIAALGTTIAYSRTDGPAGVHIWLIRDRIECATLPATASAAGLALCETLFGKRFAGLTDVIAATLSNVNGQAHLAMVLANFTRMERAERWHPFEYATEAVSRFAVALDGERLATAAAFAAPVQTFAEFLHFTYHVPHGPVADMFKAMHALGDNDMAGPTTLESRWITQDMPFIIAPLIQLAGVAGTSARLHQAGIEVLSALYGRDLCAGNDILPTLGLQTLRPSDVRALARSA
jgi:opine dehydrogenase